MTGEERSPVGFWGQTRILMNKNWLTRKRNKKITTLETSSMLSFFMCLGCLQLLYFAGTISKIYPEQRISYEYPQDVLFSELSDTYARSATAHRSRSSNSNSNLNSNTRLASKLDPNLNLFLVPLLQYLRILWGSLSKNKNDKNPPKNNTRQTSNTRATTLNFPTIHVVPNDQFTKTFTQDLMQSIWTGSGSPSVTVTPLSFQYYPTEKDLVHQYETNRRSNINIALILRGTVGKLFKYSIRINPGKKVPSPQMKTEGPLTTLTCRGRQSKDAGLEKVKTCPANGYFFSKFLALQSLVEQAVVKLNEKQRNDGFTRKTRLSVTMENYPKKELEFLADSVLPPTMIWILLYLTPLQALICIVNGLVILIVSEKEKTLKDGLRMVGVSDGAYWSSWIVHYLIYLILPYSVVATGLLFIGTFRNLNLLITFLLFFTMGLSSITFSLALTSFFDTPKTAGVTGMNVFNVMCFLAVALPFAADPRDIIMFPLKLISPVAFVSGIHHAYRSEKTGGIALSDLVPGGKGDLILYALLFLVFDILLYVFIAFYLDNVLPNSFGVRQHPLFCFRPSFWRKPKAISNIYKESEKGNDGLPESDNSEPVAENLRGKEVIRIRNICKTYSGDTSCFSKNKSRTPPAVKDLSLNIYEGQITAILGRNGAGKSTLFNILSGLVSPTSGNAIVFGLDTSRSGDQAKIRTMTGVCLQSNICFASLTVEEHLIFYGKLRGLKNKELNDEIGKTLRDLKLAQSYEMYADKLSGGQQRKLSVAVALLGDSKIILLDEPTAGFDPASRRYLWNLLQRKKEGKVILLTTHFMDEADILAERKAIIHDGILKCVGSSLFLKNRFGAGYYLTVEMKDLVKGLSAADTIIKKLIPAAIESRKVVGHEIKYSLPYDLASKLPLLFAELEAEIVKDGGSIKTYSVSMTTLEDVFLKVSNDSVPLRRDEKLGNTNTQTTEEMRHNLIKDYSDVQRRSGSIFCSMVCMRFHRIVRSPGTILIPTIVMLVFFIPFAVLVNNFDTPKDEFLILSDPAEIYDKSALRVAVNEPPTADFSKFLTENNIIATSYSGKFEDLLGVNNGEGSMAAVTISSQTFSATDHELVAGMRINGTFLHAPGIMLALISKYFNRLSQTNPTSGNELFTDMKYFPFSVHSISLETKNNSKSFDLTGFVFVYFVLYLTMLLNVSLLGMVSEIIKDKELKIRNHLRVNGLSFTMYFTSIFFVYGIICYLTVTLGILIIWYLEVEYYYNVYALTILFTLMLLYILPALIYCAIFSYLLKTVESAQTVFNMTAALGGMIAYGIINALDSYNTDPTPLRVVHIILCLLDLFYIPIGALYWTKKEYTTHRILNSGDVTGISFSTYNTPEIRTMYITLLVQIPVLFILLLVTDVLKNGGNPIQALLTFLSIRKPKPGVVHNNYQPDKEGRGADGVNPEDEVNDVAEEKSRVARYFAGKHPNQDNVVVAVKNVRKSYFPTHVLNGVNFMIEEGEVFGLLGHNGAGKTTLIRIITAEESPGSGKVHMCSYDITSNVSEAFLHLGFCPQHDALWENITLKEHLLLYATIRGIPKNKQNKLVAHFLEGLNIAEHVNKRASRLSGGTKRKLSYAMSMLGAPRIVLLDEPSTGMDPQSKRFLWNTVLATFKDSRGAMLTTHSMEEADVLCNRIAIMASGTILCIGTPQHLKNKFGTGYNIEIKLKQESHNADVGSSPSSSKANTTVVEVAENAPKAPPRPGAGPAKGPGPVSVPVTVGGDSLTRLPPAPASASVPIRAAMPPQQGIQHDEAVAPASTEIEVPPEFRFVVERFPNSKLVELFENRAVFSVLKAQNFSLAEIFTTLENWKATGNVEEYSFSQTTLEEIFLMFNKDDKKNA